MRNSRAEEVIVSYFRGFEEKNLEKITRSFTADIILRDWNGLWTSKERVGAAIRDIVESANIKIVPRRIYEHNDGINLIATCVIDIYVNDEPPISVVDMITLSGGFYGGEWSISKIEAFKQ